MWAKTFGKFTELPWNFWNPLGVILLTVYGPIGSG